MYIDVYIYVLNKIHAYDKSAAEVMELELACYP